MAAAPGPQAVLESVDFLSWTAQQLASYVVAHVFDPAAAEAIRRCIVADGLTGARANAMTDLQWGDYAAKLGRQGPGSNARVFMPLLSKLRAQHSRLLDLANEIVGHRRMQQYDFQYTESEQWCLERGGAPYFNPAGWYRYGFYPNNADADGKLAEIMDTWHIAYHGTKDTNIDSIVKLGLLPPGEVRDLAGNPIQCKHCGPTEHGKGKIFVSPSIEYSSHYLYTDPKPVEGTGNKHLYVVFQLRVRPGSYRVQGNTFGGSLWEDQAVMYDERFGPDELEWVLTDPENLRITGLMVKIAEGNPVELVKQRFARNKAITEARAAEGRGRWFFNSAPSTGNTLSQAGPWQAYTDADNARIERAYRNGQRCLFLGEVRTDIGVMRYFVDFNEMEQRRTDNNTLRRLLKRERHAA